MAGSVETGLQVDRRGRPAEGAYTKAELEPVLP